MYYQLRSDGLAFSEEVKKVAGEKRIGVFTSEEWGEKNDFVPEIIRYSNLESRIDYLFGKLWIPSKLDLNSENGIYFYIMKEEIIFIDDENIVSPLIEKIQSQKTKKDYTLERFLYEFLTSLVEEDFLFLEKIETEISDIEEQILKKSRENFNQKMIKINKNISRFYKYYSQLINLGELLLENKMGVYFNLYTEKVLRLKDETQILREYNMQVQDIYHSEISIKQNDVMKVLTIVTTIFLPLTLLVGWYGMNFKFMPELSWKYGYPAIIVAGIFIVIICLWIFKKKKFW